MDLQGSCKDGIDNPIYVSSSFPAFNIFHNRGPLMKTKKPLALLHCYKLNSRLYWYFTGFSPSFPFLVQDPVQDTVFCLVFPWSLLGCDSVSVFPCFHNLTVLGSTAQLFCRMPLSLRLSDTLTRNTAEGKCPPHHVPTGGSAISMISS